MKRTRHHRVIIAAVSAACALLIAPAPAAEAIRVKQSDGVWWFVDAAGKPFVSLGVNHVEEQLILAPHNTALAYRKYGADIAHWNGEFNPDGAGARKWLAEVKANFRAWGFNTFAYHTTVPLKLVRDFPFIARIRAASVEGYNPVKDHPDVFSDDFAARVEAATQAVTAQFSKDANLLGYAYSDLVGFNIVREFQNDWVRALLLAEATTPAKQQWLHVLKTHHADAAAAARLYHSAATTWDELARETKWNRVNDPAKARADTEAMVLRIVERYYRLHHEAIRRHDPHHLVLGDKLLIGIIPAAWPVIAKYTDLVNLQWYAHFAQQQEDLARVHRQTGKPILLADSSFAIVKPYQTGAKGVKVASQDAVGDAYFDYLQAAMKTPYIVGWHYCGYLEGHQGMTSPDIAEDKQSGFLDPWGKPFDYTLQRVTAANQQAHEWHREAGKKVEPKQ